MKEKILKILKNEGLWVVMSMYLGFILGWYFKPTENVLKCPECNKLLAPDEACKLFYDCEYGFGTLGNLHCYCNGTWKVFGYQDLIKKVK